MCPSSSNTDKGGAMMQIKTNSVLLLVFYYTMTPNVYLQGQRVQVVEGLG
jgi:hypothetical protein